jgi:Bax protein
MNIPLILRQHAGLTGLVILLVVAFILKNAEKSVPIVIQADRLDVLNTPAAPQVFKGELKPQQASTTRAVSSANAAASISHAIEASLRPKVEPLPKFSDITDVKTKKAIFFKYMDGLSNTSNHKIVQIRTEIQRMQPGKLTQRQLKRLNRLSKSHKIKTKTPAEQIDLLLRKIDTIPTALVLAQAANESAWGTSRFATQGNNLFGQWCFSLGCGLVPSGRPEGASYEVRKFKDPQESVDAYIRNLNSHGSYSGLRRIRECLIGEGLPITARALSAGLLSYSSRGVDYIDDIRSMIRVNKLEPWQKSWWGNADQHPCSELVQLARPAVATEDPIHGITTPETY